MMDRTIVSMMELLTSEMVLGLYVALLLILSLVAFNVVNPCNKAMVMISFVAILVALVRAIAFMAMGYLDRTLASFVTRLGYLRYWNPFRFPQTDSDIAMMTLYITIVIAVLAYISNKRFRKYRHEYFLLTQAGKFECEKAMPNSNYEVVHVLPAFQATVLVSLDGVKYVENGQCFWVDEGLLTSAHVIDGYEYCCIYRDENHKIELKTSVFEVGQGDYACCRNPVQITQRLGLSKGKLANVAIQKDSGVSVNVTAFGKRSIGFLNQHPQFGFVEYTGSTAKGFSGAPYYFGRMVFGMHLGADSVNIGYDAAFLKSELRPSRVIKSLINLQQEDSASWLVEQLDRQEDVQYWQSPFDPSEYKVRVGNMYHIVDGDVLSQIMSKRKIGRSVGQLDYLSESLTPKMVSGSTQTSDAYDVVEDLQEVQQVPQEQEDVLVEVPAPIDIGPENRHEDPLISVLRGLVKEFGKTSVYTAARLDAEAPPSSLPEPIQPEVVKVDELPLAPRNAMTFNDSGNLLRAPAVDAGAHGMVSQQVPAQYQGPPTYPQMVFPYPPPLANYHMESRSSMPVPQNVAFTRTQRNRNRRAARQQKRSELEQYRQRFGPLQNGGATSQQPPTPMHGSTENSTGQ